MNDVPIKAHRGAHTIDALRWRPARSPAEYAEKFPGGLKVGSLAGCNYCGSMHPAELAAAIRVGARLEPSDRKYGWPHKFYVEGVPNPHAGQEEIRGSGTVREPDDREGTFVKRPDGSWAWTAPPAPAPALTHGKFYTEHLQDATPEDREVIERAMGLRFNFSELPRISWSPFE